MVDLNDLCISEGKAVWVLYADIVCLNDDGNVFDASLLALVSALKNGQRSSSLSHTLQIGLPHPSPSLLFLIFLSESASRAV